MATESAAPTGEYEFSESQNQLIGSLARKMGLVGFVMTFFGLLQLFNGITSLVLSRNPDRIIAAAKEAGLADEQLGKLRESLSGSFWSSPITMTALAIAAAGLLLFLVGLWTRQAAFGFAGIVLTKGKDVSRLMDAIGAMHRKYSVMYTVLMTAAILALISLLINLWHWWRG